MNKVLLVMHDSSGSFYRMNKTAFETMPVAGQYIYNSDGLAYVVEEVCLFAGYVSEKGAIAILVVKVEFKPELTAISTDSSHSARIIAEKVAISDKVLDYGCGTGDRKSTRLNSSHL